MVKESYRCNHCGQDIKCYESEMNSCGIYSVTTKKNKSNQFENFTNTPRKFYCEDCMKHIAIEFLREL